MYYSLSHATWTVTYAIFTFAFGAVISYMFWKQQHMTYPSILGCGTVEIKREIVRNIKPTKPSIRSEVSHDYSHVIKALMTVHCFLPWQKKSGNY